jgi:hypothetical protein
MTLYTDLIEAGQPVSNWQSDLYCPVNSATRELLNKHQLKATVFKNRVEGGLWYDVPFQFDPFWERRT